LKFFILVCYLALGILIRQEVEANGEEKKKEERIY